MGPEVKPEVIILSQTPFNQSQNKKKRRKIWSCDKDFNKFPSGPKHEDGVMVFGAYCPIHKFYFTKIMKKDDFRKFNQDNDLKDRHGNFLTGMTALFYQEVSYFKNINLNNH